MNSKWRIAAIVLAVVALAQGSELFRIKSALKNVFHYDVEVTVKDKDTGKTLELITTHSPRTASEDVFRQSFTFAGGMGPRRIRGIAYEPRQFGFSADGYKRENIWVTKDTKRSITVELEPKNNNGEQVVGGKRGGG